MGIKYAILVCLGIFASVSAKPPGLVEEGASLKVKPSGDEFHVEVKFEGESSSTLNLKLEKADSVFSVDFTIKSLTENEDGESELTDHEEVVGEEGHRQVYVDPNSKATVNIDLDSNGHYKVSGVINGKKISHHEDDKHILTPIPAAKNRRINDAIQTGIELHPLPTTRILGPNSAAIVETLLIVDLPLSQSLASRNIKLADYFGIFFNEVNARYLQISSPTARVRITGIITLNNQPAFVAAGKIAGSDLYDMEVVLDGFSKYVPAQTAWPKYDVVMFMTGEKYADGTLGIAYVSGACNKYGSQYYATSVSSDHGVYDGTLTVAHELAHNLGVNHDKEGNTADPCDWSKGYMMSYINYDLGKKHEFSSCSKAQMKAFLTSQEGSCLEKLDFTGAEIPISRNLPGQYYTLDQQCKNFRNDQTLTVFREANEDPSKICRELRCRTPADARGSYSYMSTGHMALEYTPCDAKDARKVCRNNACVLP